MEMLRGLPEAATTATLAIEVARRTGETTAEVFTALGSEGVEAPTDEMRAVVDLALSSGAPDEAVRAVVNYGSGSWRGSRSVVATSTAQTAISPS